MTDGVSLEPLTCPACTGAVPLVDADETKCPYCGAAVPVPEALRQLRRGLASVDDERAAAARLYRRLGTPPPRVLRAFTFFDSPFFWMFALGFWVVAGLTVFILGVPWVGEHLLKVNTIDVLSESQQQMISMGGTFGSIAVGLLLAGWSRKRMVSLGSLQAALAAAPPRSSGGPAQCRRCGAALSVAPGALGVRCDYCRADNLVAIPPDWLGRVQRLSKNMASEGRAAIADEAKARASLRWSLLWRLVIGGSITGVMVGAMALGEPRSVDASSVNVYGDASFLPQWTRDQVPRWSCDATPALFRERLGLCDSGRCENAMLVALERGRPYQVHAAPEPLEVSLELHFMGFLSSSFRPVARADVRDGVATLTPPVTGWYRVRFIGGEAPTTVSFCGSQP